ncbi:hypothetical protein GCM10023084_02930 [Streptomyces lacrimifluminis]|uniref:hypothetical protein n=1 Tax=Streptomyces lacrimifluminis TaxID=1500077 RepID=UPI0031EFBE39
MTDRPARARFTEELGFVADLTIEGWLDEVLDEHAHHLAELQRNHWLPRPPGETADYVRGLDDGLDKAADLIDPKVQR